MDFVSTRGRAAAVGLSAALAAGLAPDGGLYVPARLPALQADEFAGRERLADVAETLLQPFFAGDPLAEALPEICREAFSVPAPLRPLSGRLQMLELFHGPTAAFKDFGARFLAACMARIRGHEARPLTILVATSGDTGAAVAAAFDGRPGLRVRVLYPDGRVSPRQAHQLGAFGDSVRALRVTGSFDDCQALVKRALADRDLQARTPLTSANSISLGRLLPQMVYYAAAALAHWRRHRRTPGFVIPTGNLGNALACILAREMGLPIGPVWLATNANDVLPKFLAGGAYRPGPSRHTLANAMDVGSPSNFERLQWLFPDPDDLRARVRAASVPDAAIGATIRRVWQHHGLAVCPHTATAFHVLDREADEGDWIVVATAHPAKFETIVEPLIVEVLEPPPALARLLARPSRSTPMGNSWPELVQVLAADA